MLLRNRFNGFATEKAKTVETVFYAVSPSSTGLKPGVNETDFEESQNKY